MAVPRHREGSRAAGYLIGLLLGVPLLLLVAATSGSIAIAFTLIGIAVAVGWRSWSERH